MFKTYPCLVYRLHGLGFRLELRIWPRGVRPGAAGEGRRQGGRDGSAIGAGWIKVVEPGCAVSTPLI